MGDTSFDVDGAVFGWFDRWLKGNTEAFPASTPKVRYYAMGENKWKASASWPPASVKIDRKSVVSGKSVSVRVDLGGRRRIKKKKERIMYRSECRIQQRK